MRPKSHSFRLGAAPANAPSAARRNRRGALPAEPPHWSITSEAAPKVSLITITANRPFCFNICERWLSRMLENYRGEAQLIVVDGGEERVKPTLGQEYYQLPFEPTPLVSFWNNLEEALKHVKHNIVGFIEDDDYYSPFFLARTLALFSKKFRANIVGEGNARYWHVPSRSYVANNNKHHASLCQTFLGGPMVDAFRKVAASRSGPYLDMVIWRLPSAVRVVELSPQPWCVGMKGMPGRGGFVPGHKEGWYRNRDVSGDKLRSWIGADAELYLEMSENAAADGQRVAG